MSEETGRPTCPACRKRGETVELEPATQPGTNAVMTRRDPLGGTSYMTKMELYHCPTCGEDVLVKAGESSK